MVMSMVFYDFATAIVAASIAFDLNSLNIKDWNMDNEHDIYKSTPHVSVLLVLDTRHNTNKSTCIMETTKNTIFFNGKKLSPPHM